jgi:hypothetical protein
VSRCGRRKAGRPRIILHRDPGSARHEFRARIFPEIALQGGRSSRPGRRLAVSWPGCSPHAAAASEASLIGSLDENGQLWLDVDYDRSEFPRCVTLDDWVPRSSQELLSLTPSNLTIPSLALTRDVYESDSRYVKVCRIGG